MKVFRWLMVCALSAMAFATWTACTKQGASDAPGLFAYVSLEEEIAQRLIAAYETETGAKVSFVRLSTGEATARIDAEKANPQASLWLGGVGLLHGEAKEKGLTVPHTSPATQKIPAKFRDPEGYWNGIYLGLLAFVVNKDLLAKKNLKAPEVWNDLLDPKWKGQIQIPNPGTSGTSYNVMTMLIQKMGEEKAFEYLKALHKNVSQYTRSGAAPSKNVALGETWVAVGFAQDILRLVYEQKAPVAIHYPQDGTGYEVAAASLLKGGKALDQAKKLVDWLYSPKAAQVLADHFIVPIVQEGATLKTEALPPKDLKLIDVPLDWAGKNKQQLIEKWNTQVNH